jgi:2-polyprenyl-3-methyl-5-hydroxy-6-metoxy-1,4-benzoquinol methylase
MAIFTTEITSDKITSDNPIHQRLFRAYVDVLPFIHGDVLELGCGEGRGIDLIEKKSKSFTAVDKIDEAIKVLKQKYDSHKFFTSSFPPVTLFSDNSFDTIISFQVIEHIKDDMLFINEIFRLLKPGGTAILTTPNILMTLTRNPWHIREYTSESLLHIASKSFKNVEMKGISGNNKVMKYYNDNKKSVQKFKNLDILNLEKILPAAIYKIPYEILNRLNRNKLKNQDDTLVSSISVDDYFLKNDDPNNLDLFLVLKK